VSIKSRVARERAALASARRDGDLALEACDLHLELYDHGYVLFPLAVGEVASALGPAESCSSAFGKAFAARYVGRCAFCDAAVVVGELVRFRPSDRVIAHAQCAGDRS
jgi:hypothetical protein